MIIRGDRQVLTFLQNGKISETINACIFKSSLWKHIEAIHITQNMRAIYEFTTMS
jgi:hypothetical protein